MNRLGSKSYSHNIILFLLAVGHERYGLSEKMFNVVFNNQLIISLPVPPAATVCDHYCCYTLIL